jgi:hypothetical protein
MIVPPKSVYHFDRLVGLISVVYSFLYFKVRYATETIKQLVIAVPLVMSIQFSNGCRAFIIGCYFYFFFTFSMTASFPSVWNIKFYTLALIIWTVHISLLVIMHLAFISSLLFCINWERTCHLLILLLPWDLPSSSPFLPLLRMLGRSFFLHIAWLPPKHRPWPSPTTSRPTCSTTTRVPPDITKRHVSPTHIDSRTHQPLGLKKASSCRSNLISYPWPCSHSSSRAAVLAYGREDIGECILVYICSYIRLCSFVCFAIVPALLHQAYIRLF